MMSDAFARDEHWRVEGLRVRHKPSLGAYRTTGGFPPTGNGAMGAVRHAWPPDSEEPFARWRAQFLSRRSERGSATPLCVESQMGGSLRASAMGEPDWGVDEAAQSFGPGGWSWEPVYSDRPEDVPEVAAARAVGFFPADEAPLWCFIPAIWPVNERAWVRDCRVRHLSRSYSDGRSERLPWTAAEYGEIEDETNRSLAEWGAFRRAQPAGSGCCVPQRGTGRRKRCWMASGPAGAMDRTPRPRSSSRTSKAGCAASSDVVVSTRRAADGCDPVAGGRTLLCRWLR